VKMAAARPLVSVRSSADGSAAGNSVMPAVFLAPIRPDIVQFVHTNMNKNARQAYGVHHVGQNAAGMEHSAESWGTGRAVSRIPRVSGGGTSRAGQAAFGNMCRKGRMFAPLRVWRKWHRKVNTNQKRHAVASALAASACAPLVLARGHRVMDVPELPLVSDSIKAADSTSALLTAINQLGGGADLKRVRDSRKMRAGQGKMRNSRFTMRKGPLIVYGNCCANVRRCARNLPGVDTCNVNRLNLLQLAPGGHLGRFVMFTNAAFQQLDSIFGTYNQTGEQKSGYQLARTQMDCADLARIINSDNVQGKLRAIKTVERVHDKTKKNPLTNKAMMQKLNPFAKAKAAINEAATKQRREDRAKALKAKRSKAGRASKATRTSRFNGVTDDLRASFKAAHEVILEEIRQGKIESSESEGEESDE